MAHQLQREIRAMLETLDLRGWVPELVATRARENLGIDDLWAAIDRHAAYLSASGQLERKRSRAFAHRVRALVVGRVEARIEARVADAMRTSEVGDPYSLAQNIAAPLEAALPQDRYENALARAPRTSNVPDDAWLKSSFAAVFLKRSFQSSEVVGRRGNAKPRYVTPRLYHYHDRRARTVSRCRIRATSHLRRRISMRAWHVP